MKICDAHIHTGQDYFYYHVKDFMEFEFPLIKLVNRMNENGISKSIVAWCPSIKEITCCSSADLIRKGRKIISKCPKCGKILAVLDHDPYRSYNLRLIEDIKLNRFEDKITPFFIIHMQNPFIREEIDFYLKKYPKFGLKFHTLVSRRSINSIKGQLKGINLPILVHSGPETFCQVKALLKKA